MTPHWHIGRMPTLVHTLPLDSAWNGRADPLGGAANGMLYVGVSSGEEGALLQAGYECCRFRGSVSALETATGRIVWKTCIIGEPQRSIDPAGTVSWAPSGGGVGPLRRSIPGASDSTSPPAIPTPGGRES